MLDTLTSKRLWDKIVIGGPDSCWPQTVVQKRGYGTFWHRGKMARTTHVVLEDAGKPRPPGLYALHTCDNPRCCNPSHLYWGTQKRNMQDCQQRGRMNPPIGHRSRGSKLTAEKVLSIRACQMSRAEIAKKFGISITTVSHIRNRKTWKHLS